MTHNFRRMLPRRNICFILVFLFGCLLFIMGYWNGREVALEKNLKEVGVSRSSPGVARKLQLSQTKSNITFSTSSPLPLPINFPSAATSSSTTKFDNIQKREPVSKPVFGTENERVPENDMILDVEEADIPKMKPMNKTVAKLNAASMKLPSLIQRSLFPFTALRHSPQSIKHPWHFASVLLKSRMALELGNQSLDISKYKPLQSISKRVVESEKYLSQVKIPLKSIPKYNLGDTIPAEDAKHILVVTSWRSGSTFLSDILNHYPGTYYSFEPLHYLSRLFNNTSSLSENDIDSEQAKSATDLMSDVLQCNYDKISLGYLSHAAMPSNQFLFKHNFRIWNVCSTLLPANAACFMPEFHRQLCPLFPIRLVKIVRLRVRFVEELLQDPVVGRNLKILMLVRDPRGVMKSRSAMSWCENLHCSSPKFVCDDLDRDLESVLDLNNRYPGKIMPLRYEDLSLEPFEMMDKMFDFLGLPPSTLVEKFLETHTQTTRSGAPLETTSRPPSATTAEPNTEDPYSTSRNSKATAFAWKSKIDFTYMNNIQENCKEPMQKLGYNLIKSQEERDDRDFEILAKTSDQVSNFDFYDRLT